MQKATCRFVMIVAAGLLAASSALGQQAADPYAQVPSYQFGQPKDALLAIEAQISAAKPADLRAIEAKLVGILQSPAATPDAKDWACRRLRQVGSEQCVAAVAPLLADKDLATAARWALQSIPGPKVDQALRDALGKVPGDLKAGLLQTIGSRADRQAVAQIAPLAGDPSPAVAEAALYALGRIGGPEAVRAVENAKVPEALKRYRLHALLLGAEHVAAAGDAIAANRAYDAVYRESADEVIRTGALRGLVVTGKGASLPTLLAALKGTQPRLRAAAAKFACEVGGPEVLGPVCAELASLPADAQTVLLGLVNDRAVLGSVVAAAASADEGVRRAAVGALGRLGDASAVPKLLAIAASKEDPAQADARKALGDLPARDVNPALAAALQDAQPAVRIEAIRALVARVATSAAPALLKLAEAGDEAVREEALGALGTLADAGSLPSIVRLLVEAKTEPVRRAAEAAVAAACRRADNKDSAAARLVAALPGAGAEARCGLLRAMPNLPVPAALAALRAAASDPDATVKDAAVRALAAWPDAEALGDLAGIVRSAESRVHRALALRGLVRILGLPSQRPARQTVKLFADAMQLAGGPDDKKLVLAALAEVQDPAAMDLATGYLGEKPIEVEAATAVAKLAKGLVQTHPDAAAEAMQKILDVCKTPAARRLAEGAATALRGLVNIAPQGVASSPDGLEKDGAAGGDQAAIDGNPATYWDELDGQPLYRLVVALKQPEKIVAVSVMGHGHHKFAPKDFEILCDGKVAKKVQDAKYDDNLLVIPLDEVTCQTVELKITGYYGGSPAIRELGIYRRAVGK